MHIESQIGVEHEHLWYNLQGCAPVLHMIQQKLLVETIILNNNFQYFLWSLHLTVYFFSQVQEYSNPTPLEIKFCANVLLFWNCKWGCKLYGGEFHKTIHYEDFIIQ